LVRIEAIENELMTVTIVKREPNKQRKTKEKIGEALVQIIFKNVYRRKRGLLI